MPRAPRTFDPFAGRGRTRDQERGSAAHRLYDRQWRKARASYLLEHPLCIMCEAEGITTAATVVDHRIPHRGDLALFWDRANWQPLCQEHHDSDKQRMERSGRK